MRGRDEGKGRWEGHSSGDAPASRRVATRCLWLCTPWTLRTTWFYYVVQPTAHLTPRQAAASRSLDRHNRCMRRRRRNVLGRPQGLGVGSEVEAAVGTRGGVGSWAAAVGTWGGVGSWAAAAEPGVGSEVGRRREPGVGSEGAAAMAAVPFGRRPRGLGVGSEARASRRRHFRSGRRPEAHMVAGGAWAWRRRHRRPGGSSPRRWPREGAAEVEASAWWSRPG